MFEHLDDHNPGRAGTGAQLAAVRNRARDITRGRRRSQLAVGSVTLTAAASVSGLAVLTGAGPLRHAEGQVGAGGAAAKAAPGKAAAKPDLAKGAQERAGKPGPTPEGTSGAKGGNANVAPVGSDGTSRGKCNASTDSKAANTPPPGYVAGDAAQESVTDGPGYLRGDGADGKVWVKVTCLPVPADERTDHDGTSYTEQTIAGRTGYVWHTGTDEAGVEWTAADNTAVYIKAVGAPGVRMSDADLVAFAESLPAT